MEAAATIYTNAAILEAKVKTALQALLPVTDEYDLNNTSEAVHNLELTLRQARMLLVYERFAKLSREDFITLTSAQAGGLVLRDYTISSFDTPSKIAAKFGMNLDDLTQLNNLKSSQFTQGRTIHVYVPAGTVTVTKSDIPVYGSHKGRDILGTDIPAAPFFVKNDLAVLSPEDTFIQGVNILTSLIKGDYPMVDIGITNYAGSDLPDDLVDNLLTTELLAQLDLDGRIASADAIVINRQEGAITAQVKVTSINGYSND
jgi:hypothetical protein